MYYILFAFCGRKNFRKKNFFFEVSNFEIKIVLVFKTTYMTFTYKQVALNVTLQQNAVY